MFAFALVSVVFAAAANGLPNVGIRQDFDSCGTLANSSPNGSNFTLVASSVADGANSALVLGPNSIGISGANAVLVTAASYTGGGYPGPSWSLLEGALIASADPAGASAYDLSVNAGSGLGFIVSEENQSSAQIYCIQSIGDPAGLNHPHLAVNGQTEDFSLCASTSSGAEAVIYQSTNDNGGEYDYDSCYAVNIEVVY
ncbi:uncharacterized protein LAESUDRAFT_717237 [Laetiporus sulphureus 93-53]|uniref:Uncharacterized protein n=1 Tax=Laetiporus sulphureus 93-53 TaxID=1314785 RepID=A0A165BYZ0_9APHY|nr:uncharacterized protein LAESUDRAFT_717237 [Laetiporus sulphureus 93-53]KZT01905.1 hypothetical protein LAESUDRAFT_717237 [Laetiporus sulphureus 93-53]